MQRGSACIVSEPVPSWLSCIVRHSTQDVQFGYAEGITAYHLTWLLLLCVQTPDGEMELFTIYVPTNHIYVGDIFLLSEEDILKPNISVREGLEIVVSVGMAVPPNMTCRKQD